MKKYILIILVLNTSDLYAHNLSLKDELLMQHTHEKLIVKDVIANDSLKIWKKLMETEYDENTKSDYQINIEYTKKTSEINLIIFQPKDFKAKKAIIDLHGCNGIMGRQLNWARKFISWKYMFITIDSLRPRGVDSVCKDYYRVPTFQRAIDAHTAKEYVQKNYNHINKDYISIFGFSHGATAVLDSLYASMGNNKNPFKNAIAFSPWCSGHYTKINTSHTKLMIIIGDRDSWTPSKRCEKMLTTKPENYILHILKGAYHSFDSFMDIQSVEGHTIGHSQKATNQSYKHMKDFLGISLDN